MAGYDGAFGPKALSMTPEQRAAREALGRLDPYETMDLQIAVAHLAIKALIVAHPEPDKVRLYYDQLLGQLIASPGVVGFPDKSLVLKDLTAGLFEPPAVLDADG